MNTQPAGLNLVEISTFDASGVHLFAEISDDYFDSAVVIIGGE